MLITLVVLLKLHFQGNHAGRYIPLEQMTDTLSCHVFDEHFLYDKEMYPQITLPGMSRDWPDARGVFENKQGKLRYEEKFP